MTYVLYNPLANNGNGEAGARALGLSDEEARYVDIRRIGDFVAYLDGKAPTDRIVLAGGDGTLHFFINALDGFCPAHPIYYYPCGSGNDFARDVPETEKENGLILLNPYISHLPKVIVNGEERYFLNGIGYGIDGYCCEMGDRIRASGTQKPINYAAIAIKGLLFHFKPRNAMVVVDGEEFVFPKAWLVPTMKGRYYGGGMMAAPKQDRFDPENEVTLMTFYKMGRIRTLLAFPSIFKGEHIYHKYVKTVKGKEITVSFDKPTALQVDGETFPNVTSYTVKTQVDVAAIQRKKEKEAVC